MVSHRLILAHFHVSSKNEALLAYEYAVEDKNGTCSTAEEKEQRFEEFGDQEANRSLADAFMNVEIVKENDINQDQLDPGENGNRNKASEIKRRSLLLIPMPLEFSYTVKI